MKDFLASGKRLALCAARRARRETRRTIAPWMMVAILGALLLSCSSRELPVGGASAHALDTHCEDGDNNAEDPETGRCYMYFEDLVTWAEAEALCAGLPGMSHLATLTSPDEDFLVFDLLPFFEDRVWIGGTDEAVEDDWRWITGEPMEYMNWAATEPNGGESDNCMAASGADRGWYDRGCTNLLPYVCEREPGAPDGGPVPPDVDAGALDAGALDAGVEVADAAPAGEDAAPGGAADDATTSLYDCAIAPGSGSGPGNWLWLLCLLAALRARRR